MIGQSEGFDADRGECDDRLWAVLSCLEHFPVIGFTKDGSITFWNNACELFYGYSLEEVRGVDVVELLLTPEIRDMERRVLSDALRDHISSSPGELMIRCKDGSFRRARVNRILIEQAGRPAEFFRVDEEVGFNTLQENEFGLQFAMEAVGDGVWDWNPQTNKVYFSKSWKAMFGYTEDEVGDDFADWSMRVHPDDLAASYEDINRHFRGETLVYQNQHRILCKNGTYKWVLDQGRIIQRTADGAPLRVIGTHTDISELKAAEEALRKSDERFRAIFDSSFQFTGLMTPDGILIESNKASLDYSGSTREDVVGKPIWEMRWWAGDENRVRRLKIAIMKASMGEFVRYEVKLQGVGGVVIDTDFSITPIFGQDGKVTLLIPEGRDVTERRKAEDALCLFKDLVENSSDAIGLSTPEGKHYYQNKTFDRLFGDVGDAPESSLFEDQILGHEVFNSLMNGISWQGEVKVRSKEYGLLDVLLRAYAIKDRSGRIIGIVGLYTDITEKKQAEEERQKLECQLRQSQKMEAVGQLAGGVAHDFNNLLQVILGNLDIIKEEIEYESAIAQPVDEVCKAAERAADLTRQLLAFGRRQVINPVNLDLDELVHDVLKMIRRVIGEHIELRYISSMSSGMVHADKGQLEQVLMNLCVNARDAMPYGGALTIQTRNVLLDPEFCADYPWAVSGDYVMLSVADTGCGMDEKTRAQIFEPFFTTKGLGEGTGLGLATVYGIVTQHKGIVRVYSEQGVGSEFRVFLKTVEAVQSVPKEESTSPVAGGSETILVAEDESMVRSLIQAILQSAGYNVLIAADGEEALRVFEQNADDIEMVILDVMMPKLSGKAVMDKIQSQHPQMRFLFSSGYSEKAIHNDFVIKDNLRLVKKPYRRMELLRIVREILDSPVSR
jgi:PAS domain S-box-containing protein